MAVAGFDAEFLERPATDIAQNTFEGDPVAVSVRAGSPPCFWQVRIDAYASRSSPPGPAWMTFINLPAARSHRSDHQSPDPPPVSSLTARAASAFRVRRPGQRVARPRDPTGGLWGPAVV